MLDGEHQHMAVCDRTLVQCNIALLACNIRYYIFLNSTTKTMRCYSGIRLAFFVPPTPGSMLSQPIRLTSGGCRYIISAMLYEVVFTKAHLCWLPG